MTMPAELNCDVMPHNLRKDRSWKNGQQIIQICLRRFAPKPHENLGIKSEPETISSHSDIFPLYRNFSYKTDFSTVLCPGSGVVDQTSKLVADKLLWEKKLTSLRPKDYNKALWSLRLGKKDSLTQLNCSLEKYLKHFKNDPEPYFKGDYNWLYTGGNIAGYTFGSNHYLITANEITNSMVLYFIKLDPDFKVLHKEDKKQGIFCLHENEPVFQISSHNEIDDFYFLIRQRQNMTLVRMDDDFGHFYWTHQIDNGIFISSDLSLQSRAVATLDSFLETNVYDMESGQRTVLHKQKDKSPSWAQIMFNCNGTGLYLADQHSFNMIDIRGASNASLIYKSMTTTNKCEVICNVLERKYVDNTFLIATSHNLLEIDIRNKKINQRWTHLMTSPPQFGKASSRNGEEIIVLQSENPDEMVGIINERSDSEFQFVSKSIPRAFDNIKREWNKIRLNGICTHPGIMERLDFAVTGLEILEIFSDTKEGPLILTANGGGDVMANKLKRNEGEEDREEYRDISEQSVKGLMGFEDHCSRIYSTEMTADELFDMSPLIKVLEEENLEEKNFKRRKAIWPQSEMFSPESLCYFKDYMAERILEVWDVKMKNFWDEDEEEQEEEDEDKTLYEQLGVSKVVQWMETNKGQ